MKNESVLSYIPTQMIPHSTCHCFGEEKVIFLIYVNASLFFRLSCLTEASKKVLPPAVVNGTAVWDGGSVTTRRFTQSQTTLLDQWLSPSSATKGETKERMKEQSSEKEDNAEIHTEEEQPVAVLREETEAVKTSESQQDKMEVPKQEESHEELCRKPNTEDVTISPAEEISPEQGLGEKLKCLQTDDGTEESACPVQEQIQIHTMKESVIPSADIMQETTCPAQSLPSVEESTVNQMTECWDEYYIAPTTEEMHDGTCSSNLVFASPLSNPQTHLKFSERRDEQTGWHFPAGPGLAEVVQCPLWQFPAGSYYPPIETTVPFEGESYFFLRCQNMQALIFLRFFFLFSVQLGRR